MPFAASARGIKPEWEIRIKCANPPLDKTPLPPAKAGKTRADGTKLVRTMPFDWYAKIAPADLDAIVAYLRSLNPVK
jgi:hypothetical protein